MDEVLTKMKFIQDTNAAQIYVPATLVLDSAFPLFREDQDVTIRIRGDKLVVEKTK